MGTEVLRPHDCLTERTRGPPAMVYPRRKNAYNNNNKNNYQFYSHPPKPSRSKPAPVRADQKKKASESSAAISRRYSSDDLRQTKQNHSHNLSPQITILKRGEPLDLNPPAPKARSGSDLYLSGTERLGPDPVVLKKQIRYRDPKAEVRSRSLSPKHVAGVAPDIYAGSAFFVSPAPESLPLPTFSTKKQVAVTVDYSATRDLRCLLRLD